MNYKKKSEEGFYSSIIPYKGDIVKGGHYNHNFDLHYGNRLINCDVDTAPKIARIYENLLFYFASSEAFVFNLDELTNRIIPFGMLIDTYEDNTFLTSSEVDTNDWSRSLSIYQLEPYCLIKKLPNRYIMGYICRKNDDLYHQQHHNLIKCLSLITGEYNWEFNIGLDKKIVNILGMSDNKLVLTYEVDAQKPYGLAIIETNTGALIYDSLHNGLHPHRSTLRLASQTVFCCCMYAPERVPRNHYWEFDIEKQQISRRGFLIELDNLGLVIAGVNLQDDLLYFTADYKGQWANVIGVLDYKTLKLLWWQKVEMAEGAFFGNGSVPQASENKLYILDTLGTLHIFEKEDASASSLPLSKEDVVPF